MPTPPHSPTMLLAWRGEAVGFQTSGDEGCEDGGACGQEDGRGEDRRGEEDRGEAVLVADSFLLEDGRVRGWEEHRLRFEHGCRLAGWAAPEGLYAKLAEALPATGRWFPLIEAAQTERGVRLRLRVRPAPARRAEIAVWPVVPSQPLASPTLKGPDLRFLAGLRAAAEQHGAHEALMLDRRDRAVEGALSNLMWWEDGVLCAVPSHAPILPGVTRALLLRIARAQGQPMRFALPALGDLLGCEVWLTNSLHGISRVVAWADGGAGPFEPGRAERWQRRLDALAEPIAAREPVDIRPPRLLCDRDL